MNNEFTDSEILEISMCKKYPKYFIEKYVKVNNGNSIKMDKAAIRMLARIHKNQKNIIKKSRQVGCTTINLAYILWYATFNKNKTIAINGSDRYGAKQILDTIKSMYSSLPNFLKVGVVKNNVREFNLSNMNTIKVFADDYMVWSLRGVTVDYLYIDNFSYMAYNRLDELFYNILPCILANRYSKVVFAVDTTNRDRIIETVNGLVILSDWAECKIPYHFIDGRDSKWVERIKNTIGENEFIKLFEVK